MKENLKMVAQNIEPNPKEIMYWVDLQADPQGSVIKYYNTNSKKWVPMIKEASIDTSIIDKKIAEAIANFEIDNMLITRIEQLESGLDSNTYDLENIKNSSWYDNVYTKKEVDDIESLLYDRIDSLHP